MNAMSMRKNILRDLSAWLAKLTLLRYGQMGGRSSTCGNEGWEKSRIITEIFEMPSYMKG